MRAIKFRAWDRQNKVMIQASPDTDKEIDESLDGFMYISAVGNNQLDGYSSEGLFVVQREDYEAMQYTGLLDKNGVDIFEGDILKGEGEVYYKHAAFHTENYPLMNFFIDGMEEKKSKLEVIGNIYENSKLLGENNDR